MADINVSASVKLKASTSVNNEGQIRIYSSQTFKSTSYHPKYTSVSEGKELEVDLEKAITESIKSSPELRKEIRRVFDIANKRIDRLNQTDSFDVLSPAIQAVNRGRFLVSQSEGDWNKLVGMYKEAVAFIRQPTSTVRGAREFTEHVKEKFKETLASQSKGNEEQLDYLWTASIANVQANLNGMSVFADKIKYQQIVQEVYSDAIETAMNSLEREAIRLQMQLEEDINDTSRDLAKGIVAQSQKSIDETIDEFLESWN